MKKILIFKLFIFSLINVFAQNHDCVWTFGYSSNDIDTTFGGTNINFNNSNVNLVYKNRIANISLNNASICDAEGSLQFYTNGCRIYGANDEIFKNGEGINPGQISDSQCDYGLPGTQSSVILPLPNNSNIYYLFHKPQVIFQNPSDIASIPFMYTKVDMNLSGGKGEVVEKNIPIINDTIYPGELTAVKHANGKDWWIINLEHISNNYYTTLFTSEGIDTTFQQSIGFSQPRGVGGWSNSVFSPNGKMFARFDLIGQLMLFDFDRSTGLFSNFRQYVVRPRDSTGTGGLSFSPSSRFLYLSNYDKVYQFDTGSDDIEKSAMIVGRYEPVPNDFWDAWFGRSQLGPDCRIYIIPYGASQKMHVIHNPDLKGLACNIVQHAVTLPTVHDSALPFHPHYRLGPEGNEGYPCDSTIVLSGTTSVAEQPIFEYPSLVYPNPTRGQIRIDLPAQVGEVDFRLFSAAGQLVFSKTGNLTNEEIDLGFLPEGIYFYKIFNQKGKVWSGKVVISR